VWTRIPAITGADLGKVMPGWQEALALMEPGDKLRFWIPPRLATEGQLLEPVAEAA